MSSLVKQILNRQEEKHIMATIDANDINNNIEVTLMHHCDNRIQKYITCKSLLYIECTNEPCKSIDHGSVLDDDSVEPATPPRPARRHTILMTKATHLITKLLCVCTNRDMEE